MTTEDIREENQSVIIMEDWNSMIRYRLKQRGGIYAGNDSITVTEDRYTFFAKEYRKAQLRKLLG